jgi:hypothetical protein
MLVVGSQQGNIDAFALNVASSSLLLPFGSLLRFPLVRGNRSSMASATKICTICDKPTIQRCSRCSEGLDENGEPLPSPTYYCSKTCQAANFQDHKAICRVANARKRLYRGALLVQQAFYTFREAAFDVQIPTFWKEGSTIHLYAQTTGEGPLYPFSNQLSMNEEDKKAILTWNACGDAAAYMSKLVEKVLDGK